MLVGGSIGQGEDLLMAMRQSSVTHPQSSMKSETSFFAYQSQRGLGAGVRSTDGGDLGTGVDEGGVASGGGAYTAGGVLSSAWRGLLQYPHSIHLALKLDDKKTRAKATARAKERHSQGVGSLGVGLAVGEDMRKLSLQAQALHEIQHTLSSCDLLAARAMKRLSEARGCVDTGPGSSCAPSPLALVPAPRLVDRLATQVTPLDCSPIYYPSL